MLRIVINCLFYKLPGGKAQGYLHPIPKVPKPFHTIHIDHLGPFIRSRTGKTHILLIIDAFTKFILIYPVQNTASDPAINCLREMVKVFGVPRRIISDRDKSFTSEKFKKICETIGTRHHLNAVAIPRGNG